MVQNQYSSHWQNSISAYFNIFNIFSSDTILRHLNIKSDIYFFVYRINQLRANILKDSINSIMVFLYIKTSRRSKQWKI
jgi:hypothetical protein